MVTVLLINHEDVSVLVVQSIIPFTFFNPQSFFSFFGQTATLNHALKFPKYSIFSRELPKWASFRILHRTWGYLETAIFASLAPTLLCSLISPQTSQGSGYILTLCLCFRFRAILQALSFTHHSFLPFWHRNFEAASAATAVGTINLCKCTHFCKHNLLIQGQMFAHKP